MSQAPEPSREQLDALNAPTLIFLDQGKEVGRLVRPANAQEISQELQRLLTA